MPKLTYMKEGFWWGCVGAGKMKGYNNGERTINIMKDILDLPWYIN